MKAPPATKDKKPVATKAPTTRPSKAKPAAPAQAARADSEIDREGDIRLTAYCRYEARGRTDGHALDDWLAAEAQVEQSDAAHSGPGEPTP